MTAYKIFQTEEAAKAASQAEAVARGCNGTTAFWWSWRECVGGWALIGDEAGEGWTSVEPQWIGVTE